MPARSKDRTRSTTPESEDAAPEAEADGPGVHTFVIPGFRPALLNELMWCHWRKVGRLKRGDRAIIAHYAVASGIPKATGRRRVSLVLPAATRGRLPDPDSPWKSTLDSLTKAGLLLDDSGEHCEMGEVSFVRGGKDTTIILEDVD